MEYKRIKIGFSAGLVSLFLFFLPLVSAGAIDAEWKDQIVESQRFTLKFITSFQGQQSVDIQDPLWPEGINKISGPYTAQRTIQKEDGSFATVLQIIYTLRGDNPGIYTLPPLSVSKGLEIQTSDSLVIPILRKDESFLNYPLLLDWLAVPEILFVGQSVPLVLMMHNLEEITLPDSVSIQSPNAAIMESVSGLGEIQFSGYGEKTLFHVPMETWMLTPSAPGTLSLGAAQVKIMGLTRVTGKSSISVKALPESVSKTGAVGDFKYSLQLPEPQAVAGDTVQLKIRVEGVGNLNYMVLAEPVFPDSLTVVKKENAEFKADNFGFTGYRELQYSLTLEEKGSFRVEIPGFSWLNPQTGKVSVSPSSSLDFEVVSLQDSLSSKNLSYPLLSPQEVLKGKGSPLFNSPQAYFLLLPGFIFFLLLRIGPLKNIVLLSSLFLSLVMTSGALLVDQDTQGLNAAQVHFDKGEYKEALEYYKSAIDQWDNNAAYLYNKGVLHYLNNENAASIASLRTALYLKPTNNQIRNTLKSIERSLSLDHQFELTLFLAQDILFILFVLSVNSLFILLALSGKRHRILSALFVFLFILSGMVSGVELIRSSWLLNRKEAVIRQDIAIRKIPDFQGSPWITIPEGTSVELIRNYKGFILVHTAYGLEGWIPLDKLIRLSKENSDEI